VEFEEGLIVSFDYDRRYVGVLTSAEEVPRCVIMGVAKLIAEVTEA